ncbi:hypothetical protein THAOC_19048 [Thalassiosira oceanica]|uniref:Condensation domain-containing protein n=1 Tax=Thalassiosira oceanica TaxID=159749 RepID=K0SHT1_THAOC|nr:hypothetical protein THAOC_19048 [Thalassiosira oceanica]|eukprot:EJK60571.1 hypothetical protein THAOC_19048 [Thalassiosira oceanica]
MSKIKPNDDDTETVFEPLLETESSLYVFLAEPAITTITFFKVQDQDIDALLGSDNDGVKSLEDISTETPYSTVCAKLSKSNTVVGPGYKLVGKDKRIAMFTLAKAADGQVALIVSMTHAVADGHTYYKILGMLMGEIEEMAYTRNHNFVPLGFKAIGEADSKYLTSFSFMLCCLKSMIFRGNVTLDARYVDEEKIRKWKEREAGNNSGNVDYISTNDILTSTFCPILLERMSC